MFEYIRGKLTEATPEKAVVEVGGIGYRLFIPFNSFAKLPQLGKEVTFYIYSHIREDSHKHFGFLTTQERDLFEEFNQISGVGPKTALALVGHMELEDLFFAVSQNNVAAICKIPGVGKKTAERLLIELKDRLKKLPNQARPAGKAGTIEDAIAALINLGYHPLRAQKAVKTTVDASPDLPLAKLITQALRQI